ncbi:unnamed protein product [Sphagnum jensenii]|uniref:Uncharacterized protein n=1 Tax=Sphagnum jensenii TaxID=128206 RepID=A0ABP0VJV1_9BRYO
MPLMFSKEAVEKSSDPLVRIFRLVFYREKITPDKFYDLYAKYAEKMGLDRPKMIQNRHNVGRQVTLSEHSITWKLACRVLDGLLDLPIMYVKFGLRRKDGTIFEIDSRDPPDAKIDNNEPIMYVKFGLRRKDGTIFEIDSRDPPDVPVDNDEPIVYVKYGLRKKDGTIFESESRDPPEEEIDKDE